MEATLSPPHLLIFPFPAQGHMLALLDLAETLASKGISITILITPNNLSFLDPLLSKASSSNLPIKPLIFPFPNSPNLPPGLENTKDLTPLYFHHHIFALSALYDPLLNWFQTHPSPPIAILSDFFLGWTQNLANHLRIPRIAFYASGAFVISVFHSLWPNVPQPDPSFPDPLQSPVSLPQLPHSPTFPYYQIPSIIRLYKKSDPTWEFIRDTMIANISSWGSVFNSFYDLEAPYLDYLSKGNGSQRVWAVGPLLPPEIFKQNVEKHTIERGGSSSMEVLEWLDLQENGSVVYICFGSQAILSKLQMKTLGWALENSGVGFVWCVKEGESGELPIGFEERTKSRGLVIRGWAPQVLILKHLSVGAFLTHCGWNSTLEGLVCGVPLLAWPLRADQFVSARLIVEELGVGIWVSDGVEGVPDREELCKALVKILRENEEGKKRALEVQRLGLSAISEGGTSFNDLDKFVKEIYSLDLANGGKE